MRKITPFLIIYFVLIFGYSAKSQTYVPGNSGMFTFDQLMGVNTLRDDPVEPMNCVGFVREYHDWIIDEGDFTNPFAYGGGEICDNGIDDDGDGFVDCEDTFGPNGCICGSEPYPNEQFLWNPPYQGGTATQFDNFYDQMNDQGLTICADMKGSLQVYANGDSYEHLERIPIQWLEGNFPTPLEPTTAPNSYTEHADWFYNFAARYGSSQIIPPCKLKYHEDETEETGRGNVKYIENWNEQDKIWTPVFTDPLYPYQFTETVYAAMATMDFDGNNSQFLAEGIACNGNQFEYPVGVKFADPNMKYVMGGLYCLNESYLLNLKETMANFRQQGDASFIFDVLNFHHYSFKEVDGTLNQNDCALGLNGINVGWWISPEEDNLRDRLGNLVALRNSDPAFQGKELWLSEFGYDDFDQNGNGPNLPEIGGNSDQQTVAQWTVRSFLEIAASGFDRAMVYNLRDVPDAAGIGAWTVHSGLLNADLSPKPSWWFVKSLKNILGGKFYDGQLILDNCTGNESSCDNCANCHECARIYKFKEGGNFDPCLEPQKEMWAIWSPTSCDIQYEYNLKLACGNEATGIFLVTGSQTGIHIELETFLNPNDMEWYAKVPVSETPVFIYEGPAHLPECVQFLDSETTCNSITVNWEIPEGQEYDSYSIYFASSITPPFDPSCPDEDDLILYDNDVPGDLTTATIAGLSPGAQTYVYVIPQNAFGIPYDIDLGKPIWCHTDLIMIPADEVCVIPVTVYDCNNPNNTASDNGLFDEQDIDACEQAAPSSNWYDWNNSLPYMQLCVDLGNTYNINYFQLYNGTGAAQFTIEWSNTPDGPWSFLVETNTFNFGYWEFLSNFNQPNTGIQYLRITTEQINGTTGEIGELLICGDIVDNPDPLVPVTILPIHKFKCSDGVFVWDYDIAGNFDFEVWASTNQNTAPNPAQDINLNATGLNIVTVNGQYWGYIINDPFLCGTDYRLFIRAVDASGAVSTWNFEDYSTLPCSYCPEFLCNCEFNVLAEKMFFDYDFKSAKITEKLTGASALANEQKDTGNPICQTGNIVTSGWNIQTPYSPEYAVLDLGGEYNINAISIFAGESKGAIHIAPGRPGSFEDFRLHSSRKASDFPEWVTWEANMKTRYLLFKTEGERPNFAELKICASKRQNTPTEVDIYNVGIGCKRLGFGVNSELSKKGYQKLQVWCSDKGAFAEGQHPQLSRPGALSTIVDLNEKAIGELLNPNFQIADLKERTAYYFAYKLYTNTGQSSNYVNLPDAVTTTRCPKRFYSDFEATFSENDKTDGIGWSFEYGGTDGSFEIIETSEFTEEPEENTVKTTRIANDGADLSYYKIDQENIADGSTKWLYLRLLEENQAALEWVVWDLSVSPVTEAVQGRSDSYFGDFLEREDYSVNGASVYPNPTKNELFLKTDIGLFQAFQIIDVVGISWMKGAIDSEKEEMKLDISALPPGIYLMQLQGVDTRWQTIKFVVSE